MVHPEVVQVAVAPAQYQLLRAVAQVLASQVVQGTVTVQQVLSTQAVTLLRTAVAVAMVGTAVAVAVMQADMQAQAAVAQDASLLTGLSTAQALQQQAQPVALPRTYRARITPAPQGTEVRPLPTPTVMTDVLSLWWMG
jgi:hypothetical protein